MFCTHHFPTPCALAFAAAVWLGVAAGTCAGEQAEKPGFDCTLRLYRIDDLLLTRDWSAQALWLPDVLAATDVANLAAMLPAGGEVPFENLFGVPAPPRKEGAIRPLGILDLVKRTVNHELNPAVAPWSHEQGPASIEFFALGQAQIMAVRQTDEAHRLVARLFEQLRETSEVGGPMLSVQARWIAVEESKVDKLIGAGPKREVPTVIDAKALEAAGGRTVYRGCTTTFNRMKVFVAAGNLKTYLADFEPVVAENTVSLDPSIGSVIVGAVLEVRPRLSTKGNIVVLDYRTYVNHGGKVEQRPLPEFATAKGNRAPVRLEMDVVQVDFQTLRGSVRIPLDKTVLLGLTTGPDLKAGTVYALVVEVSASE
jgi:hypothetical protein